LAGPWGCPQTERSAKVIGRSELASSLEAFLAGKSSGKIVLEHG
jgi:acrylyl-CoA reductase (NADPH)